jgi:hypothetical protein
VFDPRKNPLPFILVFLLFALLLMFAQSKLFPESHTQTTTQAPMHRNQYVEWPVAGQAYIHLDCRIGIECLRYHDQPGYSLCTEATEKHMDLCN